jgi:hypothetical protein
MHKFTGVNLNYPIFEVIKVRITAYNEKGWSESVSETSTGAASAKTIPT